MGSGYLLSPLLARWGEPWRVFLGTALQTFFMLAGSFFLAARYGRAAQVLGWTKPRWRFVAQGVRAGIFLFILVSATGILEQMFSRVTPPPQEFTAVLLAASSPAERVAAVLAAVILAPMGEETLFRGVLYRALAGRLGAGAGIIMSALIFGAMHLDLYRLLPLAVGGAGLAFMVRRSGSLWPAVVAHATWNGLMLALVFLVPQAG